MDTTPKCIIVSGRPGSGKTTLAGELSRMLYLPKVSRDEVKEGYVSTFGAKHDQLPGDTNGKVNEVFFETVLGLLRGNVSTVIEAAFQHKLWDLIVPKIQQIAHTFIVICDLDAETSARRHLERGLSDPNREFFHGDRRVSLYRETGQFSPGGLYDAPHFDVPTLRVSTVDGYVPGIESIIEFTGGMPNKTAVGGADFVQHRDLVQNNMMKIYFAGPLFSEAERIFNSDLTEQLESLGFHVFLPQRDGVETNKSPYDKMSREERRKAMFELDRDEILDCDIFLFILDGRIPDEGACVELGIAYTDKLLRNRKRFIIGLHTDFRAAFIKSKLNPMLKLCFDQLADTREELLQSLEKWQ